MTIVGIIGAMDEEITQLIEQAEIIKTETIAAMKFHIGKISGTDVIIVKSGMGKVNAAICAQILICNYHTTHIINTGFAGSLSKELHIGDIIISTEAVQHDFDVSPIGFKKGEIPYTGLVAFPADKELVKKAYKVISEVLPTVKKYSGRICSGDQFISDTDTKTRILEEFGKGYCCEMEGAAIAQVCYLNQVHFIIIRAIVDSAEETAGEEFNINIFQSTVAEEFATSIPKIITAI